MSAEAPSDEPSPEEVRRSLLRRSEAAQRVYLVAPDQGDPIAQVLETGGYSFMRCRGLNEVCGRLPLGAGLLVAEAEVMDASGVHLLTRVFGAQPSWSALPVIVLTRDAGSDATYQLLQDLAPRCRLLVLTRPVNSVTLLTAVDFALETRRQQYDLRDLKRQLK